MPVAKITIQIPDELWIGTTSKSYPEARFTVVSTQTFDDSGVGLIELVATDTVPIITEMDRAPEVTDLELLWKQGDEALLQVETANPLMLEAPRRAGVPLQTPFDVSNGTVTWEVITTQDDLSLLGEQLDAMGLSYEVEFVRQSTESQHDSALTDRQREVLEYAFALGYYDAPRASTLTEVAEALEISPAACSDILHRAEGTIISHYLDAESSTTHG